MDFAFELLKVQQLPEITGIIKDMHLLGVISIEKIWKYELYFSTVITQPTLGMLSSTLSGGFSLFLISKYIINHSATNSQVIL